MVYPSLQFRVEAELGIYSIRTALLSIDKLLMKKHEGIYIKSCENKKFTAYITSLLYLELLKGRLSSFGFSSP